MDWESFVSSKNNTRVADHPSIEEIETLWRNGFRTTAILGWLKDNSLPPIKPKTLSSYGGRHWTEEGDYTLKEELGELSTVEDLNNLIAEINDAGLGSVKSITVGSKKYPTWKREKQTDVATSVEGESFVRSIRITPEATSPFVEARVPDLTLSYETRPFVGKEDGWKVGVFLPDKQMGYWDNGGVLSTTHDEAAIDVAHQVMADVESMYGLDRVVNAGDNIDFPALGSYRVPPALQNTTQLGIDRASLDAKVERTIAPNALQTWFQGNHEQRLTNYILDKAAPLLTLRKSGDKLPALSVASLCRFDEYDIEYIEPYPDGELWVNDHLRFEHGSQYSATPGGTAVKHLKNGVSVGYGHIHRQEFLSETRHTARGPRTHFAGSPGTLCRLDGMVPSSKTGITAEGEQSGNKTENWQQGMWVFWYQEKNKQLVAVEPISIWGGWAMWRGRNYYATCDVNGNKV